MSTISEVESAIEQLPLPQVEELAVWLEAHRAHRVAALTTATLAAEAWLERARGVARPGVTTAEIMALTRGEE
jgi:hypothetical protein